MGLFSWAKGQFIEVIEWVQTDRDTVVWKFPDADKEIKNGAQLTVREGQAALFVSEGQAADVFAAGRHELVSRNIPLLTSLKSWKYGFESPFKSDVYFFNMGQIRNMKWGTKSPILVNDPAFRFPIQLRAFGTFDFRITDPKLFFQEIAKTDPHVTSDDILEDFRSSVVTRFSSALKKSGKSLGEINANAHDIGADLLQTLTQDFQGAGLTLTAFHVENVSLPPEVQQRLNEMDFKKMEAMDQNEVELSNLMGKANISQNVQDVQKYMQFQAGSSMNPAQNNPQAGEGGSSNAGYMMQMAMGMNMSNKMMNAQQKPQAAEPMTQEKIMETLKQLGELKAAGILSEAEFEAKKKDLLSRL
ncbi:MAG: SPFH domain-containing protein [Sphingobacteriia bacterium]